MNDITKQMLIFILVIALYIIISVGLSIYFYSPANPTIKQTGYLALSYAFIYPIFNFITTFFKKIIKGETKD